MTDSLLQFSKFTQAFNQNEESQAVSPTDIKLLEDNLDIKLPEDFKLFMSNFGDIWTPDILDLIVDNEIEMNDIQQFWTTEEIIEDKESGFVSQADEELIPFASDCMGNIYAFKTKDIKASQSSAKVYFFDLDLDDVSLVADSFIKLIEQFNSLIK